MTRILKPIAYVAAAVYFIVDVLLFSVVRPISRWFTANFPMPRLRAWIKSLSPYPCLALFSVPVILLEPVKMIAAYMAATGQFVWAAATFAVGEIIKLVLVERLFELTKTKLMKIPAFAWVYRHYVLAKDWVKQTSAWKAIYALSRSVRERIGEFRGSIRLSSIAAGTIHNGARKNPARLR